MTKDHTITTTTTTAKTGDNSVAVNSKILKGQPIYIILKEFFTELKGSFVARK
jgi:hypothetical protein